jgi:hypothetical protein
MDNLFCFINIIYYNIMQVLLDIIYYNIVLLCILNCNNNSFIESPDDNLIEEINENDYILSAPKQKQMD